MPHSASLITGLTTVALTVLCVIIHYEGLRALSRWMAFGVLPARQRIVAIILGQLLLHVTGIAVFATGYYLLSQLSGVGTLTWIGAVSVNEIPTLQDFQDYFYFSAVCYTTLGFGDFVPVGALRLMTGLEAVVGLVLITWSASFTFLEMQSYWGRG